MSSRISLRSIRAAHRSHKKDLDARHRAGITHHRNFAMSSPSQALPDVLNCIDAELDNSVGRLFDFLRIQSISTDPAYAQHCKEAAEFVAKDLAGLGFDASLRETGGHPAVVAQANGAGNGEAPHVLFYGHYDVQPVDPLSLWEAPPFEPRMTTAPDGRKM